MYGTFIVAPKTNKNNVFFVYSKVSEILITKN